VKKFLILLILVTGCTSYENNKKSKIPNIDFSDNLAIEDFKNKLKDYAIKSKYPNIDD
tara:strand:+ start:2086 stop:2259 length:174 start_codon:yes stop_codon:yes gene_type:complete